TSYPRAPRPCRGFPRFHAAPPPHQPVAGAARVARRARRTRSPSDERAQRDTIRCGRAALGGAERRPSGSVDKPESDVRAVVHRLAPSAGICLLLAFAVGTAPAAPGPL